jgi:hypothetical protein
MLNRVKAVKIVHRNGVAWIQRNPSCHAGRLVRLTGANLWAPVCRHGRCLGVALEGAVRGGRYRKIRGDFGYSTYGRYNEVVITSALDENAMRGQEVFRPMQLQPDPNKDDLEFEWLLCPASTLNRVQRLAPTNSSERQNFAVVIPARLELNKTNDLDFESLLCLTCRLEAIHRLRSAADYRTESSGGIRRSTERPPSDSESKKVLNFAREKWHPKPQSNSR